MMDVTELRRRIDELGLRFGTLTPRFEGRRSACRRLPPSPTTTPPVAPSASSSSRGSAGGGGESVNRGSSPAFQAIPPDLPAASRRRAFSFVLRTVLGLTVLLVLIAPFST